MIVQEGLIRMKHGQLGVAGRAELCHGLAGSYLGGEGGRGKRAVGGQIDCQSLSHWVMPAK
jgi:hypothetical protein